MKKRIRARGRRNTHALLELVRDQVAAMIVSTTKLAVEAQALGKTMNALAETVDDHEARLSALEDRAP